ncbi:hypothetical protein [Azoarcus sp. CIB]|uniref:hypothetical protein n=1 Tax=Aromatoleum sp. (strain CIB) TaxID=198107 RepID=UPI00067D2C7A|nr:hypothetical protein [Azoarcus sp. CIB]
MTTKLILITTLLSASAILAPAGNAASTTAPVAAQNEKTEGRVSPHNHMQEKLAVPAQKSAEATPQHAKKVLHDHSKFHKHL